MSPLVSIVIPCFNAARWLRPCVESALAQTWPDTEIFVVDDGSTDESLAILRDFGDRIRVLDGPHRGAPNARNTGLAAASGDWIQFLDADDYLEPAKLAAQLSEAAAAPEAEVLYSPAIVETCREGEPTRRHIDAIDPARDLYEQWITCQLPQTGAALWRAEAIRRIGGWNIEMPCGQDHELYLRALKSGLRFHTTETSHAVYRIWSEGTLCRKDPQLVIQVRTAMTRDLIQWLTETGRLTDRHRRAAGRSCFEMARQLARYDLEEAAAYHEARRRESLITIEGPAAPAHYQLAHRFLGFTAAERLATLLRP